MTLEEMRIEGYLNVYGIAQQLSIAANIYDTEVVKQADQYARELSIQTSQATADFLARTR